MEWEFIKALDGGACDVGIATSGSMSACSARPVARRGAVGGQQPHRRDSQQFSQ